MLLYLLPAAVMLVVVLRLFEQDDTAHRTDLTSWIVALLASALWPVTVISMLRKMAVSMLRKTFETQLVSKAELQASGEIS